MKHLSLCLLLIFVAWVNAATAQYVIKSTSIPVGTLRFEDGNAVFNCDGKDEVFDTMAKSAFQLDFIKKEPGESIQAVIYEGTRGDRLEVDFTGKTKVVRVDVDLVDYGRKTF